MAESRKKPFNVDMAEQRIKRLFELAKKSYSQRPDLADRYVDIARRISMRHRVSIPRVQKKCLQRMPRLSRAGREQPHKAGRQERCHYLLKLRGDQAIPIQMIGRQVIILLIIE